MKGTCPLLFCPFTVVGLLLIRNQFLRPESFLEKAHASRLTLRARMIGRSLATLLSLSTSLLAFAQNLDTHPCLSVSTISVTQVLQSPRSQSIANQSVEALLEDIARVYDLSLWCDRRIARDTIITLEKKEETLGAFLERVASIVDAGVIPLGGAVMIIPNSKCETVEAAYWSLFQSKGFSSQSLAQTKPFGWPEGSIAAHIFEDFARHSAIQPRMDLSIEHDVWQAFQFRKGTESAAISTCLLSGFDLRLASRDGQLCVISTQSGDPPLESPVSWSYSQEDLIQRIGSKPWKAWRQRWPDARIVESKPKVFWTITAPAAAHRDLVRSLIPKKKWDKPKVNDLEFTGQIRTGLEKAILELASRTNLDFFPLPLAERIAMKEVDLTLNKARIDEILRLLSEQSGVQFRRDGHRVEIITSP